MVIESGGGQLYSAGEDETPTMIAKELDVSVEDLLAVNTDIPDLHAKSRVKAKTQFHIPESK